MRISDWSSDVCSSDLNVYGGRMAHWAAFYERIAGFREIRYFDIKGEYTGLTSKAMTAPDGKIRIPLNEEGAGGGGQIEEYLRAYNGEGIQHIAFACDDLYASWEDRKSTRELQSLMRISYAVFCLK